jgi:hypothetical protein
LSRIDGMQVYPTKANFALIELLKMPLANLR